MFVPDVAAALPNIPSLAFRGLGWLGDALDISESRKTAIRDLIRKTEPTQFNEYMRPHTSEGVLETLTSMGAIPPDYEADTPVGALAKVTAERGTPMLTSGLALGMPKKLAGLTAASAPTVGEAGARIAPKVGIDSDTGRTVAEILGSFAVAPTLGGVNILAKERALSTKKPLRDITPGTPEFERAVPHVAEMLKKDFRPTTRANVVKGVEDTVAGRDPLRAAQPAWGQSAADDLASRESAATSQYSTVEQQAQAAQAARVQAARQAEADALALEQQLRAPGRIRPGEEIGSALHSEAAGAKESLKQNVTDPLYGAAWENVRIPPSEVQGVAKAIEGIQRELLRNRASGASNPSSFLDAQLNKLYMLDDQGNMVLRPTNARVLNQIRVELDSTIDTLSKSDKTAAKQLNTLFQPVRKSVNDAFDATPDARVLMKRMGDEAYSTTAAPLNAGVTKKVLGKDAPPSAAAEKLIPSGLTGKEAVDELDKLVAAHTRAGTTANVQPLVEEWIQRQLLDATKTGDLAGGINKILSDKGYGPFLRAYDAKYGTSLESSLQQQYQIQAAQQAARDAALQAEKAGVSETSRVVGAAASERDAALRQAQRDVAATPEARFAGTDVPLDDFSRMMRDPHSTADVNRLINSARKAGKLDDAYQGIVAAFQREMNSMLTGGSSFGSAPNSQRIMDRYADALRRAGAPSGVIDDLRNSLRDVEDSVRRGLNPEGYARSASVGEKQFLYGAMGREAGMLMRVQDALFGDRTVAAALTEAAFRDPKIAQALFQYKGKSPEQFRKYILSNPTLVGIISAAQPENKD
jgi:hypothetical protein